MNLLDMKHYRVALKALHNRKGQWRFGSLEWIPDEFSELERAGFVQCVCCGLDQSFSPPLKIRELHLTKKGLEAAEKIVECVPSPVGYSYHQALKNTARISRRAK